MRKRQHTLVWFRGKDLRLSDHPALTSGLHRGQTTLLFVIDPFFFAPSRAKKLPHRMQFLLSSLQALEQSIRQKGGELLCVSGRSVEVVPRVASELSVTRVAAQRWSEPFGRKRDHLIAKQLDVPFDVFEGETLLPPRSVRTQAGSPYSVFTPFSRAARQLLSVCLRPPLPAPARLPKLPAQSKALDELARPIPSLSELGIDSNPRLVAGGEPAAKKRLRHFIEGGLADYETQRDLLAVAGTSRLSQDLKFGTLSIRQVWWETMTQSPSQSQRRFLDELLWREFAYATMWDRPEVLVQPFRRDFEQFPYDGSEEHFEAWKRGSTGVPIVDAACRQLLEEGFVENRARMISASYLTKNLRVSYRKGEAHYLKYLTDGDWAQNNMGWQWSAGCGVDAAPYFRVFNPVTQGKKFDPEGSYVRKFVPELAQLASRYIHNPTDAPKEALDQAGVVLGKNYPRPLVDLAASREEFLEIASELLRRPG
jgi:deoxyribodipyrimidine photo-lyase